MTPKDKPKTLHYHRPAPKEIRPEDRSTWVMVGFFGGIFIVTLAGCGGLGIASQGSHMSRGLVIGAMFAGSALCWTKLARGTAGSENKFLLIGFLIGAGLTALSEGICFTLLK